jgi:hypothetical protein
MSAFTDAAVRRPPKARAETATLVSFFMMQILLSVLGALSARRG